MTLYYSSENDTDYKEVKAILDNLVWNGEHIPYFYDYSGCFNEHINKLPVTPWGVADKDWVMDVCPFKTESKLFKTTKKIRETILRWLDMSYDLIKEGYEWSISDGVQKDIQQYIEHQEIVYGQLQKSKEYFKGFLM